jgi:hypothetical protein
MPRPQLSIRTLLWLTLVVAVLSAAASAVIGSRVPYNIFWSRDGEKTTTVRQYWNGRTTTETRPESSAAQQ